LFGICIKGHAERGRKQKVKGNSKEKGFTFPTLASIELFAMRATRRETRTHFAHPWSEMNDKVVHVNSHS
jgi:hypothetical protein